MSLMVGSVDRLCLCSLLEGSVNVMCFEWQKLAGEERREVLTRGGTACHEDE